jgi:four helix bundle protein
MLLVFKELLPKLPENEKYDLRDQLSRSTKAIPRLIAEGYAKKHQKMGFQKYIDDAMAECNETVVGIEMSRDLFKIDKDFCDKLIDSYDKQGRQLYKLSIAWSKFKRQP